ncbi:TldD/PmbA family protein, partial [Paraburkholderia sp. Se-20369]|nr:TldD/PmbA family protein [Paraburkholderia sp. Se-20369]
MIDESWTDAARMLRSDADFWALRVVDETTDGHQVRNDVALPVSRVRDRGAMLIAWAGAGAGYAASANLSPHGLQAALDVATARAKASAEWTLIDHRQAARPPAGGVYASPGIEVP